MQLHTYLRLSKIKVSMVSSKIELTDYAATSKLTHIKYIEVNVTLR